MVATEQSTRKIRLYPRQIFCPIRDGQIAPIKQLQNNGSNVALWVHHQQFVSIAPLSLRGSRSFRKIWLGIMRGTDPERQ